MFLLHFVAGKFIKIASNLKLQESNSDAFYVGLTDHEDQGVWKWSSTRKISQLSGYLAGPLSNPNQQNKDCAAVNAYRKPWLLSNRRPPVSADVTLYQVNCSREEVIVCEWEHTQTT